MITYIKLATLEYPRYEGDIRNEHPEIKESQTFPNFPCPPTYAPVEWVEPPTINPEKERIGLDQPELTAAGTWKAKWKIIQFPDEVGATRVREQRNLLLSQSDWTQLADSPVNKTTWATYRQALRGITTQPGFPWEVVWPQLP